VNRIIRITFSTAVIILIGGLNLLSQSTSVEIGYPHAYPGLENHMKIVVENTSCEQLLVKADRGIVRLGKYPCEFKLISNQVGEEYLTISKIELNDTIQIERRRIIIKKWPKQPAEFGRIQNGTMSRSEFLVNQEVIARISGFDMSGKHKVKSYGINLLRNGKIIFELKNTGGKIEAKNLMKLKNIEHNDIVEFIEILAYIVGEKEPRKLNDIKVTICQ